MMRVLSLGAGVQSTALALMAAHGELEPPDVAIFADTGWEPAAVYDHLAWLRSGVLPFPVNIVSNGNIRDHVMQRTTIDGSDFSPIPWFLINRDGSYGIGRRECTDHFKKRPIVREVRRLLGKPDTKRIPPGSVTMLIGISLDEAYRVKPSRQQFIVNEYPLIDRRIRRTDCLRWLELHGYQQPPKSACIGCPYTGNDRWRERRDHQPAEFAEACAVDHALRAQAAGTHGDEYMHSARVPLDQVDFNIDDRQFDLFTNECEGLCGV